MKRNHITAGACVAGVGMILGGCSSLDEGFVRSADSFADEVGAEYLEYVQADSNLDADQKSIREERVRSQQELTDAALEDFEEEDDG